MAAGWDIGAGVASCPLSSRLPSWTAMPVSTRRRWAILTFRRVGSALHVKSGNTAEVPLVAWSETRFSDPWGTIIEFQVDAAGDRDWSHLAAGQPSEGAWIPTHPLR